MSGNLTPLAPEFSQLANEHKRIAVMLSSLLGRGVCRGQLNLCAGLIRRGYNVDLVVLHAKGEMRDAVPKGVRIVDLQAPRALRALPAIYRFIRKEKPAAIICAEDHLNVVTLLARYFSRRNPPTSVSCHVLHSLSASNPIWTKSYWMRFAIRITYPYATCRIAVSSGLADVMSEVTGLKRESIETIFNPIIVDSIPALSDPDHTHPWLSDDTVPVILGAGSLSDIKDFPTLIRAFSLLRKERPAKLIILGDGPRKEYLRALVRDLKLDEDVAFPGFVQNPDTFMRKASLFVLSSIHEGLGNVLVEALACGCPAVSTDCPHGPREILDGGRYGALVPVGDVQAMGTAMIEALDSPPAADMLKQRAKLFDVDRIVDEYQRRLGF